MIAKLLHRASAWARRFARCEAGSGMVEAVIVLPAMAALYAACFVFFDANRSSTLAMKTTYTISDILSRQDTVDEPFLDGLQALMTRMVPSNATAKLRVSVLTFNDDVTEDQYRLIWSYTPPSTGRAAMTQTGLSADTSWLPSMGDDDSVIVVESQVLYTPLFNLGWADQTVWSNRMVTRPRFVAQLRKTDEPQASSGGSGDVDDISDPDPV